MRSKYAFSRPVVNTYLVRERDRRRSRELIAVTCALGLIFASLGIFVCQGRAKVIDAQLAKLEEKLAGIQRQKNWLELEEAYLRSPRNIGRRAAAELGMRSIDLDRLVAVRGR
jgi:hypothetical protein